jgi:hypothetical protein
MLLLSIVGAATSTRVTRGYPSCMLGWLGLLLGWQDFSYCAAVCLQANTLHAC